MDAVKRNSGAGRVYSCCGHTENEYDFMDCKEQCVDPCDSGDCGVSAGASAGAGKAWGKAVPYSDCAA